MTQPFVHPYVPNTAPASRRRCSTPSAPSPSTDEFYADVPDSTSASAGPLDLPAPLVAEQDLARHVARPAGAATAGRAQARLSFLGAGVVPPRRARRRRRGHRTAASS
ncbi:MAG: hypothetical protein P0Y60_03175 [Candidatus Microbacterium colombiense]|nr:MAG: hypothetical protein P0Y60_03175 [Microbacterium sp.]